MGIPLQPRRPSKKGATYQRGDRGFSSGKSAGELYLWRHTPSNRPRAVRCRLPVSSHTAQRVHDYKVQPALSPASPTLPCAPDNPAHCTARVAHTSHSARASKGRSLQDRASRSGRAGRRAEKGRSPPSDRIAPSSPLHTASLTLTAHLQPSGNRGRRPRKREPHRFSLVKWAGRARLRGSEP